MRYTFIRHLGNGGYGEVWMVRDTLGRFFALKRVINGAPSFVDALWQEAQKLLRLRGQRNVINLVDYDFQGPEPYVVMELAEGSLEQLIAGPADPRVAAGIIREVAVGLEHSHAQGIVHRDVKPGNILLKGSRCILADYGLARGRASLMLTMGGAGTLGYMAPEQFSGQPCKASDVYGLGATLFHLLTGVTPPPHPDLDPRVHVPGCPAALASLVRWMTAVRPIDRPTLPSVRATIHIYLTARRTLPTRPVPIRRGPSLGEVIGAIALGVGVGALVAAVVDSK